MRVEDIRPSHDAVDPPAAFDLLGDHFEPELFLQRARHGAAHRVGLPASDSGDLVDGRPAFGAQHLDQLCLLGALARCAVRRYKDFLWSTLDSWSCRRRVVAKAEWLGDKANPRFVVTSLTSCEVAARRPYERLYCARGNMENRIKECQLDLFADRTSAGSMRANQLRLWFASLAYVLLCALRRIGLAHTHFATATCGTLRLKLLKIGARVKTSVRRIKVALDSAYPRQAEWALAHARLTSAAA